MTQTDSAALRRSRAGSPSGSPEGDWPSVEGEPNLATLAAQFAQTRSRERVRDLAEVFTHEREVNAMLDLVPGAFTNTDAKFLEPACGNGNFLVEILRRKLELVPASACASQEHFEHSLLRATAAIYGIDVSERNITEARARTAEVLLGHYRGNVPAVEPSVGFTGAAVLVLESNIIRGDTLNASHQIELCDWRPGAAAATFQRVWSYPLIPPAERDLFWTERTQDSEPVHFSRLRPAPVVTAPTRRRTRAAG